MSDFDYANARLRAMRSRLVPRPKLEDLAGVGSIQALLSALSHTAYQESVEAALARATTAGIDSLTEALRGNLITTLGRVPGFFPTQSTSRKLAGLVLRRYDLHNLKTVLRGLARQVPADEILAITLPVGELRLVDLAELCHATNVRAAIDLLVTWRVSLAQPLLELRTRPRAESPEVTRLELALEQWHFRTALEVSRQAGEAGAVLCEALSFQADMANLLIALRLAGMADGSLAGSFFVSPGLVPLALLKAAVLKGSVPEAVHALARTPYGVELTGALARYEITRRLSVFERALARRELDYSARLFVRDPLGIGVLLGYIALKTNEVANLRAIAQGLLLGEKPGRIRAELVFAE